MKVFLIAALSADGFITPHIPDPGINNPGIQPGNASLPPSTTWTSTEDKQWFEERTKQAGVVIMGRTTYETIPEKHRPLKDRTNIIYTSGPEKVTGAQSLALNSPLSIRHWQLPYATNLPPKELITFLEKSGIRELAICGGASIYTLFMAAGVVDTLYLTIEPIIFGQGISLFDKPLENKLELAQSSNLNSHTLLLEYKVKQQ